MKSRSWSIMTMLVVAAMLFYSVPSVEAKKFTTIRSTSHLQRHYKQCGRVKYQKAYYRTKKGKWTRGHFKTSPDGYRWNNRNGK